jgi:hypothetical protein
MRFCPVSVPIENYPEEKMATESVAQTCSANSKLCWDSLRLKPGIFEQETLSRRQNWRWQPL